MNGDSIIEYRACCAAHTEESTRPPPDDAVDLTPPEDRTVKRLEKVKHVRHTQPADSRAGAEHLVEQENARRDVAPMYRSCFPWRVEARIVTGWMSAEDAAAIVAGRIGTG